MAFDVLETMDGLKSAGFSDAQARSLAESFQRVSEARQADLVTKGDLRAEIAELRTEIAELRTEIEQRFERLRDTVRDQQRWTIGILLTAMALLGALLKLH